MTKTNWSRCFRAVVGLLVATSLLAAAVAPAGAVAVADENVPEEGQVGDRYTATVTLNQLYQNPQLEEWRVTGRTDLTNVTWTVSFFDQTGARVNQESFDGQTFNSSMVSAGAERAAAEIEVRVTGTVPQVSSFRYDPAQSFQVARLNQARPGGASNEIGAWSATHYTAESQSARQTLDSARSTIDSASADTSQAEETFASAVDAYEAGNFNNAESLANRAQEEASSAEQSQETLQLALYAVGGLVAVGVVVGGVFWYRSQGDDYDKLG
jgi:hypothetical protein